MEQWHNFIQQSLAKLPQPRVRRPKIQADPQYLILKDTTYLNFISNDYLGLSIHLKLRQALLAAALNYGVGSSGAPSLSGYSQEQAQLTLSLADWLGFAKCLIFNSGYQLAVGLYAAICDNNTHIWLDKNCHASHIDGIRLAKAKFTTFNSSNLAEIAAKIKFQPTKRHIVLSEGSFSMDGSCTYLSQLLDLKASTPDNLLLIIDDAHGVAALGQNGYGTLEQFGLDHRRVDLYMGTLGKAFGCHGGFICGSAGLIDYLEQTVRSQIYSTCLPASLFAAASASLAIITSPEGYHLRQRLTDNIAYFRQLATKYNLSLANFTSNRSPIQLLIFDSSEQLSQCISALMAQNILVGKIIYPTVAQDAPRIRISLTAAHSKNDIEKLCQALANNLNYAN